MEKRYLGSFLVAAALGMLISCAEPAPEAPTDPPLATAPLPVEPPQDPFALSVAEAHNYQAFYEKQAVQAHLALMAGEEARLQGKLLVETRSGRARLVVDGGPTLVWDGSKAWVSPADAEFPRARFHIRTWPYFLTVPMKLGDPGVSLEALPEVDAMGKTAAAAKMTFGEQVGDSPEDWYLVYQDKQTGRLAGLAYTVTFGAADDAAMQEALDDPHAVTYDEYRQVDGVWLANRWTFRDWSPGEGFGDEANMTMTVDDLAFITPEPGAFDKPADAREDTLPQ